jgi:hypothetical protein
MSPERRRRPNRIDHRSDVFSAGMMFFELLCGELPFRALVAEGETYPQRSHDAPDVRSSSRRCPRPSPASSATALQRDPDAAFQSAASSPRAIVDPSPARGVPPQAALDRAARGGAGLRVGVRLREVAGIRRAAEGALRGPSHVLGEGGASSGRSTGDAAKFANDRLGLSIPVPEPKGGRVECTA